MAQKKSSQERGLDKVQELMVDTKFDRLRTPAAKRLLVVLGAISLVGAALLYWFEDSLFIGAGVLGVLSVFTIWWLLRLSVRLVADAPDDALDEFQVRQRDRTYLDAYRNLGSLVSFLAVGLMILVISTDVVESGSVERYEFSLTFGQVNAVMWLVLGATLLIPNLTLAWNQAKRGI